MKQFTMTANGFKNALSKPMVVVRMSAHAVALVASFTFPEYVEYGGYCC